MYAYIQPQTIDLYSVGVSERNARSMPFINDVLLQGDEGRTMTMWAVIDDGAMANTIDEEEYNRARSTLGELSPSQRVLRMADGRLVGSRGMWSGDVAFGGVHRRGSFKVFPSGSAWDMLFGKPLLEAFGAWHGYEEDIILLHEGGATVRIAN
ncbi:hypothetical protein C8R44DRAFT_603694, partial [Mycena epipterygia]